VHYGELHVVEHLAALLLGVFARGEHANRSALRVGVPPNIAEGLGFRSLRRDMTIEIFQS